ncbi:hydroxyisourate hydrolase, partial [Rhizobium ruizarguesonis]
FQLDGEIRRHLKTVETTAAGRVDGGPILVGASFRADIYELVFHAGDYLRASGTPLPHPAFLDLVPIRCGIADVAAHYHVPLLISPYGYSAYRGS